MTTSSALPDASGDRLVHSATALLISNATGAVLGVAFWAVAARLYTPTDVGYGVAAISAMLLLASIAQLNLSAVFPRFLHASGAKAPSVLRAGYSVSILVALVAGTVFLLFTGHHNYLAGGTLGAGFFLVAVVLWVIFTIQDSALIGLRATFWVPVENTSFSMVKIVLLPVFVAVTPRSGVFLSWVLPVIACIIPINYYLFFKVLPRHVAWADGRAALPPRRAVGTVLVGEYFGGIAYIALTTVPALLIAGRLGATDAAYFQAPWLAGTSFDFLLFSIATSLIVESSARPGAAADGVRRAVRLAAILLTPGMVVLIVGAPFLLRILGPSYAAHGTRLLQSLALALPFLGVNVLYVTFARLARRVRRIVAMQVSAAVLVLSLTAALLGPLGITGAGVAFLAGQAILALVVLPSVVRQYRRADMAPGYADDAALVARGGEVAERWSTSGPEAALPVFDDRGIELLDRCEACQHPDERARGSRHKVPTWVREHRRRATFDPTEPGVVEATPHTHTDRP